jgi:uncharacterized repeat protein (TIGR01451 family)
MKKVSKFNFMSKLMLTILVLSSMVVFAAKNETVSRALNIARPDVKVVISGSVQREGKVVSLEKVEAVKTGEILDWSINSANQGSGDAKNYRVVGQIPKGTSFVAGSAKGDESPQVAYSIDGGKTYSAQPLIDEKQADGSVKQVPAPASMYTQVRFEWTQTLAAQANLNAAYRVQVK